MRKTKQYKKKPVKKNKSRRRVKRVLRGGEYGKVSVAIKSYDNSNFTFSIISVDVKNINDDVETRLEIDRAVNAWCEANRYTPLLDGKVKAVHTTKKVTDNMWIALIVDNNQANE
jgi:hypothetical protein